MTEQTNMTKTITRLVLFALALLLAVPAAARDNDGYGETRFSELPLRGALSKTPWVGSWWAYQRDGLAYRLHDPPSATTGAVVTTPYADTWTRWDNRALEALSPAEKYDTFVGRAGNIDYDALMGRAKKFRELDEEVASLISERKTLIRRLNKAIEENRDVPDFNWQDTEDGKRYLEIKAELEEKESFESELEVAIDTAFEYEVLHHGSAQFGIESWFGHCNAWAAAAIMEPEPRHEATVNGIPFTPADVKSYLTELYMEIHSSFYGSRNGYHKDAESREAIDFQDVTPAAFHILFADLVGNKDRGFVIDRYTGSEVWNQPVRAYRASANPLYSVGAEGEAVPMQRDVAYTVYGSGGASKEERGPQDVYPVLVTTTMHWMTDGLPAETLTLKTIHDEMDDETFASSYEIGSMWDHQVEIRTLTYEIWLDKPLGDPEARVIGDGQWEHGSATGFTQLHPDFIWVPLANVNSYRDYENEYLDYDVVAQQILPETLSPEDDPQVDTLHFEAVGPVLIADNDPDNPARLDIPVTSDVVIHELVVKVDITHTYIGDLTITLAGPNGTQVELKERGDGGSSEDLHASYDVMDFANAPAAGTWSLLVTDTAAVDTGTLDRFTLELK